MGVVVAVAAVGTTIAAGVALLLVFALYTKLTLVFLLAELVALVLLIGILLLCSALDCLFKSIVSFVDACCCCCGFSLDARVLMLALALN